MSKKAVIKSLDAVIGKLVFVHSKLDGTPLNEAIEQVAYVIDAINRGDVTIKKPDKSKKHDRLTDID